MPLPHLPGADRRSRPNEALVMTGAAGTLLVTGASGFIGGKLVRVAAENGWVVDPIARHVVAGATAQSSSLRWHRADCNADAGWKARCAVADVIVHCAPTPAMWLARGVADRAARRVTRGISRCRLSGFTEPALPAGRTPRSRCALSALELTARGCSASPRLARAPQARPPHRTHTHPPQSAPPRSSSRLVAQ